jgi:RND family efflux transporter MFP subunit
MNTQTILSYLKKHKVPAGLLVVVIIGGYFWYAKKHTSAAPLQYVTQAATKGTVTVSVSATGQVSSENQIDLKPGSSGKLTAVNVKSGDTVKENQVLAVVDQSSNAVSLAQAQASVLKAQADYDKLLAGLTGSDLTSAQRTVTDAQKALDKSKQDYTDTVTEQKLAVDRTFSNLLNSGLTLVQSDSLTTASVTLSGTYTGSNEGQYKIDLYETGEGLHYSVSGLGSESGPVNRGFVRPLGNGLYVTFGTSGNLYSSTSYTIDVPNKTSSSYGSNETAYETALQNQTKALRNGEGAIDNAAQNLLDAQQDFNEKMAPPENAELASAKASLLSARASLQAAYNNYNNNVLKAPFAGVVAAVNNRRGDDVTSSTVVATVITKQQLAEVSLNEVDVAKVKPSQKATLSFDALDGLNLTGQVAEVDSLGTVSQGVVSYKVKIAFDTQDERVKPSMNVSAEIITDVKTDVLTVPNSAVKSAAASKYIQMLDAVGQPQNKDVEIGISNDALTEIVSGLNEGDEVVTQTINPNTTAAKTTTGTGIPGLGGAGAGRGAAAGAGRTQFRAN